MFKKVFLSGVLLAFVVLAGGCGTLYKGTSGLAKGAKEGFQEGAREDWSWLVKSVDNADTWFKKNLW
ncbi:MAG: hypothetical protein V1869_00205 [Candidatus Omnitrophota bacterium]